LISAHKMALYAFSNFLVEVLIDLEQNPIEACPEDV